MSQRKRRSNESATTDLNPNRILRRSKTSITRRGMEAFSIRGGRGVVLSGSERAEIVKVIMFPFVGDTKAVLVGPRVSDREIAEAQQLLRRPKPSARKRCTEIRSVHFAEKVAA